MATLQRQIRNCINIACCLSLIVLTPSLMAAESKGTDWAGTHVYHDSSQMLSSSALVKGRVVFMGDSITQGWGEKDPTFLDNVKFINRGISGQTTPQMLLRFRQDVLNLSPEVVVILAGTNDIAANTGYETLTEITDNLTSMVELAKAHGAKVILCQLVPADHYGWAPDIKPVERIAELNQWIRDYAPKAHIQMVDFFTPMVVNQGTLNPAYGNDGVHPNVDGYEVMKKTITPTLQKLLGH